MSLNFQSYWYTYCVQARGRLYRARYCLYKRTRKPYSYRAETRRLLRRSYEASAERCNFCRCPAGLARACESLRELAEVSGVERAETRHTTYDTSNDGSLVPVRDFHLAAFLFHESSGQSFEFFVMFFNICCETE